MSSQVLLSFGEATTYLEKGKRIARTGWNGKGMYLVHFSPVSHGLEMLTVYDKEEGTTLPLLPFILMKTADNCYVPWLASQTDILAKDWVLVETESQKGKFFNTKNKFQSESKQEVTTSFNDEDSHRVKIRSFDDELFTNIFSKQNSETIKTAPKTLSEALNVKKIADDFEDKELEKACDDALAEISDLFKIPVDMLIGTTYFVVDKKDEECTEAPKPVDESVTDFKAMELKIIEQITELSDKLKQIQNEKERSKGSVFDTIYAPDDIILTVNFEKNKKFWEFVKKAKANNHKRIVLATGEQYKINDDCSVTQIL